MELVNIELDDKSAQIAYAYAAGLNIPVEGAVVLSIVAAASSKAGGDPMPMQPANERLSELADAFEKEPPSTQEDREAFAEQLRYLAQFTTTFDVPQYSGRKGD